MDDKDEKNPQVHQSSDSEASERKPPARQRSPGLAFVLDDISDSEEESKTPAAHPDIYSGDNDNDVPSSETSGEEVFVESPLKIQFDESTSEEEDDPTEDSSVCIHCGRDLCVFVEYEECLRSLAEELKLEEGDNSSKRRKLYQKYARGTHGTLGKNCRKENPHCVVRGVRALFPANAILFWLHWVVGLGSSFCTGRLRVLIKSNRAEWNGDVSAVSAKVVEQ